MRGYVEIQVVAKGSVRGARILTARDELGGLALQRARASRVIDWCGPVVARRRCQVYRSRESVSLAATEVTIMGSPLAKPQQLLGIS